MLSDDVDAIRLAAESLLELSEAYLAKVTALREHEQAKPDAHPTRVQGYGLAVREATDLVDTIENTVFDRILRIADRQPVLSRLGSAAGIRELAFPGGPNG